MPRNVVSATDIYGTFKKREEEEFLKSLKRPKPSIVITGLFCTGSLLILSVLVNFISDHPGIKIALLSLIPFFYNISEEYKAKRNIIIYYIKMIGKLLFFFIVSSLAIFHVADYYFKFSPSVLTFGIILGATSLISDIAFLTIFPKLISKVKMINMPKSIFEIVDFTNQKPRDLMRMVLILSFLLEVILIPICDEILYRGIITLSIFANQSAFITILMSSLTYAFGKGGGSRLKYYYSFFHGIMWSSLLCAFHGNLAPSLISHVIYKTISWSYASWFIWSKVF